jgi:uncharacterized membrane protein YebE (DUF533 family)
MFDPQRLLKQMLGGALGGTLGGSRGGKKSRGGMLGGMGTGGKAALGLGALGVAMAAWEHYKTQPTGSSPAPNAAAGAALPTAPSLAVALPPPPPPGMLQMSTQTPVNIAVPEALLAIRSMIAAAAADGLIDGNEREAILQRAASAGLEGDDQAALRVELAQPLSLPELIAQTPPAFAAEVYVAALITISIDTEAERRWLQRLADGLRLTAEQRAEFDARFAPSRLD